MSLLDNIDPANLDEHERVAIERGSILGEGANEEDVAMLKGTVCDVPVELQYLLRISDGFLMPIFSTRSAVFLGARDIALFSEREPEEFRAWESVTNRVGSDEYGPLDSECGVAEVDMPKLSDLGRAVVLSQLCGGVVLLAYRPEESRCTSWEYMKLSSHTASRRYGSLLAMLTDVRDASLASLADLVAQQ
ncbi:MAG TPA: hypothetical protein VLF18_17670 [Tahibacter sp.]|nr:hypothetical protein [Tahibacter sp.]